MIYDRSRDGLAEGCCSAIAPCSHQRCDPTTICEVCKKAAQISAEEARELVASERVFAALATFDGWMADKDPDDAEPEVYAFEAMKAALEAADARRTTSAPSGIAETAIPQGVSTRTVYVALDGSEHGSVRGVVEKNAAIARTERANAMLAAGATVYDAARAWSWMDNPTIPDVLRRITKDTPLIISHWQCRDAPGYTVCRFENDEYYVYVGGDAGSWSGPYGSKITLADIARYAEDTLRKHPELAAPAGETGTAETEGLGAKHEHAVGESRGAHE